MANDSPFRKISLLSQELVNLKIQDGGLSCFSGLPRSSRLALQACERRETVGNRWQARPPPCPIPLVFSTPKACRTSCGKRKARHYTFHIVFSSLTFLLCHRSLPCPRPGDVRLIISLPRPDLLVTEVRIAVFVTQGHYFLVRDSGRGLPCPWPRSGPSSSWPGPQCISQPPPPKYIYTRLHSPPIFLNYPSIHDPLLEKCIFSHQEVLTQYFYMQHTVFAWYPSLQMMFSRHPIQKMHNRTTGEEIARPKYYSIERRRYAENMRKRDTQNTNMGTYKNLNFFTLSYSSGIKLSSVLRGFLGCWKKHRCPQRAFLLNQSGASLHSPFQIKIAIWRTFFKFELARPGVAARCKL